MECPPRPALLDLSEFEFRNIACKCLGGWHQPASWHGRRGAWDGRLRPLARTRAAGADLYRLYEPAAATQAASPFLPWPLRFVGSAWKCAGNCRQMQAGLGSSGAACGQGPGAHFQLPAGCAQLMPLGMAGLPIWRPHLGPATGLPPAFSPAARTAEVPQRDSARLRRSPLARPPTRRTSAVHVDRRAAISPLFRVDAWVLNPPLSDRDPRLYSGRPKMPVSGGV